jgi:hypothetical protein
MVQDPYLQQMTASEPLTLDEEYEMQVGPVPVCTQGFSMATGSALAFRTQQSYVGT